MPNHEGSVSEVEPLPTEDKPIQVAQHVPLLNDKTSNETIKNRKRASTQHQTSWTSTAIHATQTFERLSLRCKLVGVLMIPMALLLLFVGRDVIVGLQTTKNCSKLEHLTTYFTAARALLDEIHTERGQAACMGARQEKGAQLLSQRSRTDQAAQRFASIEESELEIGSLLSKARSVVSSDALGSYRLYTAHNKLVLEAVARAVFISNHAELLAKLVSLSSFLTLTERVGQDSAIGCLRLLGAQGKLDALSNQQELVESWLHVAPEAARQMYEELQPGDILQKVGTLRDSIREDPESARSRVTPQQWLSLMTLNLQFLHRVAERLVGDTSESKQGILYDSWMALCGDLFLFVGTVTISGLLVSVLGSSIDKSDDLLRQQVKRRKEAEQQTTTLLNNMLPKHITRKLRRGRKVEAEEFKNVTVLFTDIVGFTEYCSLVKPTEVMQMLHTLYTVFDRITENNKTYKVETIGDAYMVVCGINNEEDHALSVVSQAHQMLDAVKVLSFPRWRALGRTFQIRIGIHTGPAVAGVVGEKMPRYGFFGDTVNTASRMESTGLPGKVHVSLATAKYISKSSKYACVARARKTMVKGKGAMETFMVVKK